MDLIVTLDDATSEVYSMFLGSGRTDGVDVLGPGRGDWPTWSVLSALDPRYAGARQAGSGHNRKWSR
jgi:hypothetical protein